MTDPVPCPWCKTTKSVAALDNRQFYCRACDKYFDDEEDPGDYSTRDPTRRLQREEERARKRREELARR